MTTILRTCTVNPAMGVQRRQWRIFAYRAFSLNFDIKTESGRRLVTKTLVVATGTQRNRLGVAGEKPLLGRGVSYCVDCDANFFRDQDVAVVGGESAAVSGAVELTHTAKNPSSFSQTGRSFPTDRIDGPSPFRGGTTR